MDTDLQGKKYSALLFPCDSVTKKEGRKTNEKLQCKRRCEEFFIAFLLSLPSDFIKHIKRLKNLLCDFFAPSCYVKIFHFKFAMVHLPLEKWKKTFSINPTVKRNLIWMNEKYLCAILSSTHPPFQYLILSNAFRVHRHFVFFLHCLLSIFTDNVHY